MLASCERRGEEHGERLREFVRVAELYDDAGFLQGEGSRDMKRVPLKAK